LCALAISQAIGARLAKSLGKGMNAAVAGIRSMSFEQIAQYEREKAITVNGVEYLEGEIKVRLAASSLTNVCGCHDLIAAAKICLH
jgi:hypothetical protein